MSWIEVGIQGTARVVELKTSLKGLRQKNTLAVNSLNRHLGIFKECVSGDDQKPSGFLNSKLKKVHDALTVVENTYDLVTNDIYELTSILCEMQNSIQLSEAQINELKTDVHEQEKKQKRTEEKDEAIRESNKLLVKWE